MVSSAVFILSVDPIGFIPGFIPGREQAMSVLRSIVMLATVALAVAFALFVGHGIAVKHMTPVYWGIGFLAAAVVLAVLQTRTGSRGRA
jgi:steroid 5-alpha reductase family enzyme